MCFGVFIVLIVTTFVTSCSSFINAETYAVDDDVIDSTEVRRLRFDKKVEEERAFLEFSIPSHGDKVIPSVEDLSAVLKRLDRYKNDMEQALRNNGKKLYKLVAPAVEGSERKRGILRRVIEFSLLSMGVGAILYIVWALTFKTPAPSSSALKNVGSTTTA